MMAPGRNDIRVLAGVFLLLVLLVAPVLACPYDTGGHLVSIRAIGGHIDTDGFTRQDWKHPITNATITATGIQQEAPDWFWSLLGVEPKETNINKTERSEITDEKGVATLALYDSMLYNVSVRCSNGNVSVFKLYPSWSEYNLFINC